MTDFSAVSDLGELDPDYFEALMNHPSTTIEVHHDGEVLFGDEDPTRVQVGRPRMVDAGGTKKATFKVNLMTERVMPDLVEDESDGDDESEQTDSDGTDPDAEGEDADADNDGTADSDDDDEGKMTFTMADGPTE